MNDPFKIQEGKIQVVPQSNENMNPVDSDLVQYELDLKKMNDDIKALSKLKRNQNIMKNETLTQDNERRINVVMRIRDKLKKKQQNKIVV